MFNGCECNVYLWKVSSANCNKSTAKLAGIHIMKPMFKSTAFLFMQGKISVFFSHQFLWNYVQIENFLLFSSKLVFTNHPGKIGFLLINLKMRHRCAVCDTWCRWCIPALKNNDRGPEDRTRNIENGREVPIREVLIHR